MYKRNLALLNNRYGELERRVFEAAGTTGGRVFVIGAGGDLQMANAAKDGLVTVTASDAYGLQVTGTDGFSRNFPITFICYVTDAGMDFVAHYMSGAELC